MSKVKLILYMLGKGGISVLQTAIFEIGSRNTIKSFCSDLSLYGAVVAEWLSSWLAEQEDWGSIPGLAT